MLRMPFNACSCLVFVQRGLKIRALVIHLFLIVVSRSFSTSRLLFDVHSASSLFLLRHAPFLVRSLRSLLSAARSLKLHGTYRYDLDRVRVVCASPRASSVTLVERGLDVKDGSVGLAIKTIVSQRTRLQLIITWQHSLLRP